MKYQKNMAELGAAVAILQIAQLPGQVALKTHSIANKLKHGPRVIKSNLSFVNDFAYILRALESALNVESVDRPGTRMGRFSVFSGFSTFLAAEAAVGNSLMIGTFKVGAEHKVG